MAFLFFAYIFLLKQSIKFVNECQQSDWILKHCQRCHFYHFQRNLEMKDVPFRKVSHPSHHC